MENRTVFPGCTSVAVVMVALGPLSWEHVEVLGCHYLYKELARVLP